MPNNYGFVSAYLATSLVPLPDAREFALSAYNKAYPQVVAFSTAVAGILLISLLIRSFWGK